MRLVVGSEKLNVAILFRRWRFLRRSMMMVFAGRGGYAYILVLVVLSFALLSRPVLRIRDCDRKQRFGYFGRCDSVLLEGFVFPLSFEPTVKQRMLAMIRTWSSSASSMIEVGSGEYTMFAD